MGQDNHHKLEIFRGMIKFKSNVQKIWGVLIFLSIVTAVEVALGIIKPQVLMSTFLSMKLINWIFKSESLIINSLAQSSAIKTGIPKSLKKVAAVVFPLPITPVNAIFFILI